MTLERYNDKTKKCDRKYQIRNFMDCGSNYHNAKSHVFTSHLESNVKKLNYIMKKLGVKTVKINKESFRFTANSKLHQKMMFKLCRYVRDANTIQILDVIIKSIKAGVSPQNALVLGHYCTNDISVYYRSDMDIIPRTSWARKGISTLEEFNDRKSSTINYFFKTIKSKKRKDLVDLIRNKKYIEAEQFILN